MFTLLLLCGLSACQSLIMNYTKGLLPQDVFLVDLSAVVKNLSISGTFNPSKCEVNKSSQDSNKYELLALDGSLLTADMSKLAYLKVTANSTSGIFQYKLECVLADKPRSVAGTIIIDNQTAVKTNQTTDVKLYITAKAFEEYRYSKQELWYPLSQVKANNLQGNLLPDTPASINQISFFTKVPTINEILNGAPTELPNSMLWKAYFLRSCGLDSPKTAAHCLLGIKEDRKTAVLFRYVSTRSYWIKSGEKQLSENQITPFDRCFGWPLGTADDILCYFSAANSNSSIISFNSNQQQQLDYKITDMRHLSAKLLCFKVVKESSTRVVCINDQHNTLASFTNLFNGSVERFKLRSVDSQLNAVLSNCFIEVSDFFAHSNKLDSFGLNCQGKSYFGNFNVKNHENANLLPLNIIELDVEQAKTFPQQLNTEAFLCANSHYSIFYSKTASSWRITYLSMKKPDQQLGVDMELGPPTSIDQVHCTEAGADFFANLTDGSSYFVSIDGINRDDLDMQRLNRIEKINPNHTLHLAINARTGLIFNSKESVLSLPGSFREFNRQGVKQLMLKYSNGYQQLMNSTLLLYSTSSKNENKKVNFWFEQGDQYPSVTLKPEKKLPKDLPRIRLLDYFDLKGKILTIELEASEHAIKMNYTPVVQQKLVETVNTTLPKLILGEFVVNLQNLTFFKEITDVKSISNSPPILNQSFLLGTLTGDLAVICSDSRKQLQLVFLNKTNGVGFSRIITLDIDVAKEFILEASALQTLDPNKSFRLEITGQKTADSFERILINISRNEVEGSFDFSTVTNSSHPMGRNPTQQDVSSIDSYTLTLLHYPDPETNLCLRLILEGGLLLQPFEYRVCNHQIPINHLFRLRRLSKKNFTHVELDLLASSNSPSEGDSVFELKILASLFNDAGPLLPETVVWEVVSSKRWRNYFGGQVIAFVHSGNSTILIARSRSNENSFMVSFYLRGVLVSSWEETVAESGGLSIGKYNGRDCIVSKNLIRCVELTDPVMELPDTMLLDFHTHLYLLVNRGYPNEVRIPVLSILESTKPLQPPSPISFGLVVWIVALLLLCSIIIVLVYLLKREIVKKNATVGTSSSDETLTEL